ncbi:hypothetical protein [Nostoc sp.]
MRSTAFVDGLNFHQLPMRSCAISQGVDLTPFSYQPKAYPTGSRPRWFLVQLAVKLIAKSR